MIIPYRAKMRAQYNFNCLNYLYIKPSENSLTECTTATELTVKL
jgi:hypothetical protein